MSRDPQRSPSRHSSREVVTGVGYDLSLVASKWVTDMENAQAEIQELVRRTKVYLFYLRSSLIPPAETRARCDTSSTRSLKRREIRALEKTEEGQRRSEGGSREERCDVRLRLDLSSNVLTLPPQFGGPWEFYQDPEGRRGLLVWIGT